MRNWIYLFILVMIFVSGCNQSEDNKQADKQKPPITKQTEIPPPSFKRSLTELEKELMKAPGSLSGSQYNEAKVRAALDRLPKNLNADQYMQHLLALLAEDYRSSVTTFVNFDSQVKVNNRRPDEKIVLPASKKMHISILLDASGSMNQKIDGKTKMDSAKDAIIQFSQKLPQNAQISLRVYGNEGTGSQKDKELSCNSTKEIFNGTGKEIKHLQTSLQQVQPAGWTPIANALETVKQDIQPETTDSVVYVVSDGIETCGGNAVQVAKELHQSKVKTVVNIIGFDVDNAGQKMLKEVADSGGGEFASVDNDKALHDYLEKAYDDLADEWEAWKEKGKAEAESQKEAKKKTAEDTKEKMKSLAEVEKAHLKAADEYLKEKRGDTYPHSDVFSKILNRYSRAWGYAVDTGNRLWSESVDSGNKEWSDIVDEGNKKWGDAIDKKTNP